MELLEIKKRKNVFEKFMEEMNWEDWKEKWEKWEKIKTG